MVLLSRLLFPFFFSPRLSSYLLLLRLVLLVALCRRIHLLFSFGLLWLNSWLGCGVVGRKLHSFMTSLLCMVNYANK
jgi:hypothetical protein